MSSLDVKIHRENNSTKSWHSSLTPQRLILNSYNENENIWGAQISFELPNIGRTALYFTTYYDEFNKEKLAAATKEIKKIISTEGTTKTTV